MSRFYKAGEIIRVEGQEVNISELQGLTRISEKNFRVNEDLWVDERNFKGTNNVTGIDCFEHLNQSRLASTCNGEEPRMPAYLQYFESFKALLSILQKALLGETEDQYLLELRNRIGVHKIYYDRPMVISTEMVILVSYQTEKKREFYVISYSDLFIILKRYKLSMKISFNATWIKRISDSIDYVFGENPEMNLVPMADGNWYRLDSKNPRDLPLEHLYYPFGLYKEEWKDRVERNKYPLNKQFWKDYFANVYKKGYIITLTYKYSCDGYWTGKHTYNHCFKLKN